MQGSSRSAALAQGYDTEAARRVKLSGARCASAIARAILKDSPSAVGRTNGRVDAEAARSVLERVFHYAGKSLLVINSQPMVGGMDEGHYGRRAHRRAGQSRRLLVSSRQYRDMWRWKMVCRRKPVLSLVTCS